MPFEVGGPPRPPSTFEIPGAREAAHLRAPDLSRDERLVADPTGTEREVDPFLDDVDVAVGEHDVELHVRVRAQVLVDDRT